MYRQSPVGYQLLCIPEMLRVSHWQHLVFDGLKPMGTTAHMSIGFSVFFIVIVTVYSLAVRSNALGLHSPGNYIYIYIYHLHDRVTYVNGEPVVNGILGASDV